MPTKETAADRRKRRGRYRLRQKSSISIRLCVFQSNNYIYAQVIDDQNHKTLASAGTIEKDLRAQLKSTRDKTAALLIGKIIAQRANAVGVESVVFDKGMYRYHGKVKALADSAREAGLRF